ncbi:UNVERIFIED_CONTAM: hypothetical protein RMT77_005738 [Armadillidium vulgare]
MKYYLSNISWFLTVFIIFISFNEGHSIHCYECDSSLDMTCGETLADGHTHTPNDCSYLQEPSFCVKMTGLYEGELGTKRFCSARDFGNYCEMVRRPGDERLYRACTYTCSKHSCNIAPAISNSSITFLFFCLTCIIFNIC